MSQLADLPNLGEVARRQLNQVGIFSCEDLEREGAERAWLKVQISTRPPAFTAYTLTKARFGASKRQTYRLSGEQN